MGRHKSEKQPDLLSQRAAAAKAAGMSYGKWVALQYERNGGAAGSRRFRADEPEAEREKAPEETPAPADEDGTPRCLYCKQELRGRQKFWCSAECRYRYQRRLNAGRAKEDKRE